MRNPTTPLDLIAGATVYLNKPLGWSSFQLLNKFRLLASRHLGVKRLKVGHAGTLDPLATGVMVLCTGKHTKRIEELQRGEKEYIATLYLGATTPTLDRESEPDEHFPTDHISREAVERALASFVGEIDQVPPIFSAVKVDGKRAYNLARKGRDVELQAKKVQIHSIELLDYDLPEVRIRVRCGKGTYIRSLARDIGVALDSGAYLSALERTQVGQARLEQCLSLEEVPAFLQQYALRPEVVASQSSHEPSSSASI